MNGIERLEDTYPHGTIEGFRRGCKGGACPGKTSGIGDTCSQASIRYAGDWEYKKAVDAGLPLPPMLHDKPEKAGRGRLGTIMVAPTVVVADSVAPLPEEPVAKMAPAPKHPTMTRYLKGCKVDEECPSFIAGGQSCGQFAKDYWFEQKNRRLVEQGLPPRKRREKPTLVRTILTAAQSVEGVEATVTELPNGGAVVTVRIPAMAVAS